MAEDSDVVQKQNSQANRNAHTRQMTAAIYTEIIRLNKHPFIF